MGMSIVVSIVVRIVVSIVVSSIIIMSSCIKGKCDLNPVNDTPT